MCAAGCSQLTGLWTDQLHDPPPREAAVEAFVEVVEAMARRESRWWWSSWSLPNGLEALRRLAAAANCAVILAVSRDAAARAEQRIGPIHCSIVQKCCEPSDINRSTTTSVIQSARSFESRCRPSSTSLLRGRATDDGYDPPLDEIVDRIIDQMH